MIEIEVNMDKKCIRCGKTGATQSGLCFECISKGVKEGKYDEILKKALNKEEGTK